MNDQQKNDTRHLQDAWARAVERAAEDHRAHSELDSDELDNAVGLHVQSGVQGGRWETYSCYCY